MKADDFRVLWDSSQDSCATYHRTIGEGGDVKGTRLRRALSNVLLGMALGLLAYQGLTTLMGNLSQDRLRNDSTDVPVFVDPNPAPAEATGTVESARLDREEWEQQDQAYWTELDSGDVFGRLVIPRMELDVLVVNGVDPADLRRGPGWIEWTDLPGPTGTCGISGHRTTYGAPFRRIHELKPGDTIDLYSPYRLYRYRVRETLIVTPDQVEVVASTPEPTLTLTACHPPYSARYRIAVQADLVEVRPIASNIQ